MTAQGTQLLVALALLAAAANTSEARERGVDNDLAEEMQRNPLGRNPFFLTMMAAGACADAPVGTEGLDPSEAGNSCTWLGNLECDEKEFQLQCVGRGVIDCTGECPGEEELVWDMMDQMGNTSFLEQYPLFHAMMTKEKVDESVEEEEPRGPPPVLMEVATRCGFQKLRELLELATDGGSEFREPSPGPGSLSYVAPDATQGFGYKYYDYNYDYESSGVKGEPEKEDEKEPKSKAEASGDANEETNKEVGCAPEQSTRVDKLRKFDSLVTGLCSFRKEFAAALGAWENGEENFAKSSTTDNGTYWVGDLIGVLEGMDEHKVKTFQSLVRACPVAQCRVRNLACVELPNVDQCKGIAIGACVTTRTQAVTNLVRRNPVTSAIAGGVVAVGVAYYVAAYVGAI